MLTFWNNYFSEYLWEAASTTYFLYRSKYGSVIKRPTDSTASTTSGQIDTTSGQTSTTSGQTNTTSGKLSTTS